MLEYVPDSGDLNFTWTDEAQSFFEKERIFLDYPNKHAGIFTVGDKIRIPGHVRVERYANMPRKQFISAGAFSYCRSASLPPEFSMGRYCSIGPSVMLQYQEHPTDRISTHPFTTHAHMGRMARDEFDKTIVQKSHVFTPPPPRVGSDVWIGAQVIIKRNISIGHGAVIATRSVVTKDVPPYAIVGGLPARIIRYRFDAEIIADLLNLEWWNYNFAEFGDIDPTDVPNFISKLSSRVASGIIKPMEIEPFRLSEKLYEYLSGHSRSESAIMQHEHALGD